MVEELHVSNMNIATSANAKVKTIPMEKTKILQKDSFIMFYLFIQILSVWSDITTFIFVRQEFDIKTGFDTMVLKVV